MYRWFYEGSDLLRWPMLAMFLFIAAFVSMLVWVIRNRPSKFETVANLPLADDDPGAHHEVPSAQGQGGSHV